MNGVGLLVVYTSADGKNIEYWVNEGCDMLNSQMEDDGTPVYYTTPDQTVTEMMNPTISQGTIKSATLWTIVQSGNWDANTLWVNDINWTGICDGTPYPDLDVDVRDITEHLRTGKNIIRFQAVGDYAVPSGSFLVVEMEPTNGATPAYIQPENTAGDASATKETPGFKAVPVVVSFLIIISLTIRRCSGG